MSPARVVLVTVVAALLTTALAALGGSTANASPTTKRSIAKVSAMLDSLRKQYEILDDHYNGAVAAVAAQQKRAASAQRAARAAAQAAVQADNRVSEAAAQRYEQGGAMNSTGLLLTSTNPQDYLQNLGTLDYLSGEFATLASQARTARAQARVTAAQAAKQLTAARAKAQTMRQQRAALVARTGRFEQLLKSLNAKQRQEYARARMVAAAKARAAAEAAARQAAAAQQAAAARQAAAAPAPHANSAPSQPAPPTPSAPSSAVQRVVAYAEAQVGKAYVFGASGPNAYDCSGLTMMAWAQAGVSLPHQASAQYNVGQHISYSQLQPGDLIFLYNPIGHVELYVGHDLAVSAADPALGVIYTHPSQDMADYAGATRP